MIQGSTQCVVGGNILSHCDLLHSQDKSILSDATTTPMYKDGSLSYIKSSICGLAENGHAKSAAVSPYKCSADSKVQIIDKAHKHVCRHSSYSDMVTLPKPSNFWYKFVEDYPQQTVSRCDSCRAATPTLLMRKVSIKGLSDPFNRTIQVDHMFWMEIPFSISWNINSGTPLEYWYLPRMFKVHWA